MPISANLMLFSVADICTVVYALLVVGNSASAFTHPARPHNIQRGRSLSAFSATNLSMSTPTSTNEDAPSVTSASSKRPFRIRTITAFVTLKPHDFNEATATSTSGIAHKIDTCNDILRKMEASLTKIGFEVQTVRISTNPFGEWLTKKLDADSNGNDLPIQKKTEVDDMSEKAALSKERLDLLDNLLDERKIAFCSLGPSTHPDDTINICPLIVSQSGKFSCSANIETGDVVAAHAAARCMKTISQLGDEECSGSHVANGLGNFRFCAASCIDTVPFFPGAKAPSHDTHTFSFAIGMENGGFARKLLKEAKCISNIKEVFDTQMRDELMPIQAVCKTFGADADYPVEYLGIDTSLNPSLDDGGSVADAIECLDEVRGPFGGTGSLAAAAAITTALQSIPDIQITGYSGLMLPVLEDHRLAKLATSASSGDRLTIQKLLCISSVCGVGIDTVPVPGDVAENNLSSLILDVAGLAHRWSKSLSCRVFPTPGGKAGDMTLFDSPYMCNSCIFDL